MKSIFYQVSVSALLAAALLTGCNNQEMSLNNDVPVEESGKLSFVLPLGVKDPVTYAIGDPVPGLADEYAIGNLFIYWFKNNAGTYKLAKTFKYGVGADDITLSPASLNATQNQTLATINVGNDNTDSRFYMLANINTGNGYLVLTEPATGMTAADFEDLYGSVSVSPASSDMYNIQCPLPMSINKTTTANGAGGYVSVLTPSTQGTVSNIHLKRRVARFDIVNTAAYSGVEIANVIISRAMRAVWMQDKPFATTDSYSTAPYTMGSLNLDVTATANGGDALLLNNEDLDGNGIDDYFDANPADTARRNEAVFYLLPTVLSQDHSSGTEIVLAVKNFGKSEMYQLNLPNDVPIDANKRYTIKVLRSKDKNLKFNLTVDHWDDGTTITSEDVTRKIGLRGTSFFITKKSLNYTVHESEVSMQSIREGGEVQYNVYGTDTAGILISILGLSLSPSGQAANISIEGNPIYSYPDGDTNFPADLDKTRNPANILVVGNGKGSTLEGIRYYTDYLIKLPPTDSKLQSVLRIVNPVDSEDVIEIPLSK